MTRGIHALPVLKTIGHGYQEALGNIGAYVLQASLWAVAAGALEYLLGDPGPPPHYLGNIAGPWATVAYYAAPLAEFAMLLFGNVAIAVSAYRAAIRNEPPTWQHSLRLGRREFRYLGLTLVLFVVECAGVILLIVIALMGAHMTGDDRWAQRILTVASTSVLGQLLLAVVVNLVIAATVTPLFGLAFPLAAMDAPAGLLRRAARMSRGYRGRLGAISFLAVLPFTAAAYLPFLAWTPTPGTAEFSVREAAFVLIGLLGVAFATAAFAAAFRIVAARDSTGVYAVFD